MARPNYDLRRNRFLPDAETWDQGPSTMRFGSAAEAIQLAIEVLPSELLLGTYLEVQEATFEGEAIRRSYDGESYPLERKTDSAR